MKRSVAIIGMALLCVVGFFGLTALNQPKGFDPDSIPDVTEYLTGMPSDTTVATVDGEPITAGEFLYWAGYSMETMENAYGELDWAGSSEGEAVLEYVRGSAMDTCVLYRLVETKANEMGCGLTAEDLAGHQADYDALMEQVGGEKATKKWLLQIGLTEKGFEQVNQAYYFYQNLLEKFTDISPATEEEMADYIAEKDILKAKHILFMTIDPGTRQPLSEEEQAAKKALAEEISALLQESDEPLALFDELMKQYSEDGGLATNPDGYIFTANEMVAEFEQGTRDLEYNEISGLIQSPYGYHIILRLNPGDEAFAADLGQLLGETEAQETMDTKLSDWLAEAEVDYTEAYDTLDLPAYYGSLKALRAEIEAADAELAEAQK